MIDVDIDIDIDMICSACVPTVGLLMYVNGIVELM